MRDPIDAWGEAMLQLVLDLCYRILADEWGVTAETVAAYMGGAWGGYWYCLGCGQPQLGEPPWEKTLGVKDRCRPCGPGRGWVRCPATHTGTCVLCRGEGWVEEI